MTHYWPADLSLTLASRRNLQINRDIHNRSLQLHDVENDAHELRDVHKFLRDRCNTCSNWKGTYLYHLATHLNQKRVLELGSGDGQNLVAMALLGAEVTGIDIAELSAPLTMKLAALCGVTVSTITADVCQVEFPARSFDLVLGRGFIHHLTHEQEDICLDKVARWISRTGEVRLFENAENNPVIDRLRWYIPMPGRPSKLNRYAFAKYRSGNLSHPNRDNSSRHYERIARAYFHQVSIDAIGGLERFSRFFPVGSDREVRARQCALRAENHIPKRLHHWIARCQLVRMSDPITD